jgi:hypothetical protein
MRKPIAVVSVVFGAVLVAGFALSTPFSRKPLDDYVAARKAAGKPVRLADVAPPVPATEANGATEFDAASAWLERRAGPRDGWTVKGPWNADGEDWADALTPEEAAGLGRFLADAKPYFDGLDAAIAKGRIVPPLTTGTFDDAETERRITAFQLAQARALAATAAEDRLAGIVHLAALAARTESRALIDDMIAAATMTACVRALQRESERGTLDHGAAWRRLEPHLDASWIRRIRAGARLERASMLEFATRADFSGARPVVRAGGGAGDAFSILRDRIAARLRAMADGGGVVENSPAEFAAAHAALEPAESVSETSAVEAVAELRALAAAEKSGGIASSWANSLVRVALEIARTEARVRLARIALAAGAMRAKFGALPASLDALAPSFAGGVPLDPFTDAPFEFTANASGVRIASAGRIAGDNALDDDELAKAGLLWELRR